MKFTMGLAALLMAILITGCGTSRPAPKVSLSPQPATPGTGQDAGPGYFTAENNDAWTLLATRIQSECNRPETASTYRECFRQKLADAFGVPTEGQEACASLLDFQSYASCIQHGTVAYHLRERILSPRLAEMTPDNWRSPWPYISEVLAAAAQGVEENCSLVDAVNGDNCRRAGFGKLAFISQQFLSKCDEISDMTRYLNCIGEAIVVQSVVDAKDRVIDSKT